MADAAAKIKDTRTNEMRRPRDHENDVKMPISTELGTALARVLPAPRDRQVADVLRQEDLTTVDSLLGLPKHYRQELLKTTGLEAYELKRVISCCEMAVAHRRHATQPESQAATPQKALNPGRKMLQGVLCGVFIGKPCGAARARRGPANSEGQENSMREASTIVPRSPSPSHPPCVVARSTAFVARSTACRPLGLLLTHTELPLE